MGYEWLYKICQLFWFNHVSIFIINLNNFQIWLRYYSFSIFTQSKSILLKMCLWRISHCAVELMWIKLRIRHIYQVNQFQVRKMICNNFKYQALWHFLVSICCYIYMRHKHIVSKVHMLDIYERLRYLTLPLNG